MSDEYRKRIEEIVISEIQIIPIKPRNGLIAFASCVLNNQFYIGDIAIYSRPDGQGHRLVYPSKILPNGKRINCFHPINRETAEQVDRVILGYYKNLLEKVKNTEGKSELRYEDQG